MTHDLVEQRKQELVKQFKDYPEALLDEWYSIPAKYRDIRMKKYNILPEIASIGESIKNRTPVSAGTVHMLFLYTDEEFLDFYFKDHEALIPVAAKYYASFHKNAGQYCEYLEYGTSSIEEAEDKVMEFDGDIVITDPCYLSHNISDEERRDFDCTAMANYGICGIESDTYYGDWSCTTYDRLTWDEDGHSKPIGEFCADGGMVCVADLKSVLKFNPKYNDPVEYPHCVTLIKNFKGTVRIKIDENEASGNKVWPEYIVSVVGQGINTETSEPIDFYTRQTGP